MRFLKWLWDNSKWILNNRGIIADAALALGISALTGGGFALGNILGKKRKTGQTPQPTIFRDPIELKEVKSLRDKYMKLMTGEGAGYDKTTLTESMNPFIAKAKSTLQDYTIPTIKNTLSGAGLGRSSLVGSMGYQAGKESAQTIAEKLAQLNIANEQQIAQDKARAEAGLLSIGGLRSGVDMARATGMYNQGLNQVQLQQADEEAKASDMDKLIQSIGGAFTGGLTPENDELAFIETLLKNRTGAGVNIAKRNVATGTPSAWI